MEIYILRHGIAEDLPPGRRDADRALTSEGKRKVRDVVSMACRAATTPTLVLTSPYVRAVETAAIAAEVAGYRGDLVRTDALTPDADPRGLWDELRVHKDESSILLSTHEPLSSRLVAFLLGAPDVQVDMKKSALVRIDVDRFGPEPRGVLRWMVIPKIAG